MKTYIWALVTMLLPAFGAQALEAVAQGGTAGQEITNQGLNGRLGALEVQQGANNALLQQIIDKQAQQEEVLKQIADIVITKTSSTSGTAAVSATQTISATVKLPKGSMCGIAWLRGEYGYTVGTQVANDGFVGGIISTQTPCNGMGPAKMWQNPGGGVFFGRANCPKDYIFTVVGTTSTYNGGADNMPASSAVDTVGSCLSTKAQ